jgi:hypothetical protein
MNLVRKHPHPEQVLGVVEQSRDKLRRSGKVTNVLESNYKWSKFGVLSFTGKAQLFEISDTWTCLQGIQLKTDAQSCSSFQK